LLKQIAPGVVRAAVLRDATQGSRTSHFAAIQTAAPGAQGGGRHSTYATCPRWSAPSLTLRAPRMAV
jgi:hypothetical protein